MVPDPGGCPPGRRLCRIISPLPALGLSVHVPELDQHLDAENDAANVLGGLDEFRQHLGASLTILMLRLIGAPFDVHEIRRDVMIRSIGVLRDFEHAHRMREERHERHILSEPSAPGELVDEYFIENRTKLLEIAVFLDCLDRADAGCGP